MTMFNKQQLEAQLRQWWQRGRIHLVGPAGSVVFHVAVVLILVNFAVTATVDKAPNVEVMVMTPTEPVKLDEIMKEVEPPREEPQEIPTATEPVDAPYVGPVVSDAPVSDMPGNASGADTGLGNLAGDGIGSGDATAPKGFEIGSAKSPLVFKGLYANRTRGGRGKALAQYGGARAMAMEGVVNRALRWLKDHQKPDGSWEGNPLACTGLALLAFLAHGETPSSQEFGPTVQKAIQFLISSQGSNGSFSGNTYVHGIATYAISEAYAMTKIMPVKDAMEKAIQIIIDGQETTGGFDYSYGNSDRWDMSCCGWQFQAMKAAKMAGATNEKLEEAIKKSIKFMKEWAFSGSGWGYSGSQKAPGGGTGWTMTSAATLAMQLLGQGKASQTKAALNWLETSNPPREWPKEDKGASVYGWYYLTQVKFQEGGKAWDAWNREFLLGQIVRAQKSDGHWEGGDHDPGGFVYTTALCALMSQVYYRYLPTYQKAEDAPMETASSDDVAVKVQ